MGEGKKEPYRFSSGPTTGLSIRVCDETNTHTCTTHHLVEGLMCTTKPMLKKMKQKGGMLQPKLLVPLYLNCFMIKNVNQM
jgi:hypothetical protein